MIITCQECDTSFSLNEDLLKKSGSKVRCSKCRHVFMAYPQTAKAGMEQAQELPADLEHRGEVSESISDRQPDRTYAPLESKVHRQPPFPPVSDSTEHVAANREAASQVTTAALDEDLSDTQAMNAIKEELGDFSLDLDLDLDAQDESDTTEGISDLDDEDLDISDIEQMLDLDDVPDTGGELANLGLEFDIEAETSLSEDSNLAESSADTDLEDLDLSGVEEMLETEAVSGVGNGLEAEIEELKFDLETLPETDGIEQAAATEGQLDVEDLDLSDADKDLDADAVSGVGSGLEAEIEDLDAGAASGRKDLVSEESDGLDLELDLIPEIDNAHPGVESMDEDVSQELDLSDIDDMLGADAKTGSEKTSDEQPEDIDLSDLEKMLDGAESAASDSSEDEAGDLSLDLTEKDFTPPESGKGAASEELDLSDLENSLDLDDNTGTEKEVASGESENLELDLDITATEESSGAKKGADELDLELSEFDDIYEEEQSQSAEIPESGDIDLEFEIEEPESKAAAQSEAATDKFVEEEEQELASAVGIGSSEAEAETDVAEEVPEDELNKEEAPVEAKTRAKPTAKKRYLLILLVAALLAAGGYGAYTYLTQNDITIPFISNFFTPKVEDPGNLKMSTVDINSKFIDNANSGKFFVITGKVRNNYDHARKFVQVSGKLFSAGKVLARTENVFGGNVLTDEDLTSLDYATIKNRLANRNGDNGSNVNIQPGKSLPFMIVFSNLPDNLEEFTLEVLGSSAL